MSRLLAAAFLISLLSASGCTRAPVPPDGKDGLLIVTSFYPLTIFTLNVIKDIPGVRLADMAAPGAGCLHDYQLSPKDLLLLEKASVLIVNGAGLESFMDKVVSQLPHLRTIVAGEGIALSDGNPHVWVSITLAIREVENIGRGLAELDPGHKEAYDRNTQDYIARLEALKARMHAELDPLGNGKIITFHEAFPYFAREFNLTISAVIEREPGSEPGAKELIRLIETIRSERVKALFVEPQYPSKVALTLQRETGVPVLTLDPAVTGPEQADAYEAIMLRNLTALKEALKEK